MAETFQKIQNWWETNLNPLLAREIRQSIRSNVHVWTFIGMIYIAFLVTAIFVLAGGGSGYEEGTISYGTGDNLFGALFIVLAAISLIGIPMTAFLSHVYEQEQDCLDLLKVTTLSAGQIVRGKLLAAFSKLLLFLSALIPFFAFAYILRGISFPAILGAVSWIIMITILITMLYLYFSMLVNHGASKVSILIFLLIVSVLTGFIAISLAFNTGDLSDLYWNTTGKNLLGGICYFSMWGGFVYFLHECSRSMMMNPSRNRAFPVRASGLFVIVIGTGVPLLMGIQDLASMHDLAEGSYAPVWIFVSILCFIWCTEWKGIPRKTLERYHGQNHITKFFHRLFLPGPEFGLQFSFAVILIVTVVNFLFYFQSGGSGSASTFYSATTTIEAAEIQLAFGSYLLMYMGIAYHMTNLIREYLPNLNKRQTRGFTLLGLIVLMIGPYILGLLLFPNMVERSFTVLEFFNPAVVMTEITSADSFSVYPYAIVATIIGLGLALPAILKGMEQLVEPESPSEEPEHAEEE